MLALGAQELPPWYPRLATLPERRRALEEFDRSRVVARIRSSRRFAQDNPSVTVLVEQLIIAKPRTPCPRQPPPTAPTRPPPTTPRPRAHRSFTAGYAVPADAWPLARCDQRLTQRLGIL